MKTVNPLNTIRTLTRLLKSGRGTKTDAQRLLKLVKQFDEVNKSQSDTRIGTKIAINTSRIAIIKEKV